MKGIGGVTVPTKPQRLMFTLKYHFHEWLLLSHPQAVANVYRSKGGLAKVTSSGTSGCFIFKEESLSQN